jgi:hypothetical protein
VTRTNALEDRRRLHVALAHLGVKGLQRPGEFRQRRARSRMVGAIIVERHLHAPGSLRPPLVDPLENLSLATTSDYVTFVELAAMCKGLMSLASSRTRTRFAMMSGRPGGCWTRGSRTMSSATTPSPHANNR